MYISMVLMGCVAGAVLLWNRFPPLVDENDHRYTVCKTTRRGFVIDKDTDRAKWWSHFGRGRRHFVGEILRGLRRHERRQALALLRMEQDAGSSVHHRYLPITYYLKHCSSRVQERLVAPLRWTNCHRVFPTVEAWQCALHEWYALP